MTKQELIHKMRAFIETQDGDIFDEWYTTNRSIAITVLSDFAEYLDVELTVPEYVPKETKPEIDRNAILKELLPQIQTLFNMAHDKYMAQTQEKGESNANP